MQELIERLAAQLGIDKAVAEKATGVALAYLKDKLEDSDFGQLLAKLPGASSLVSEAENEPSTGGGGLLGGLMNAASSMVGGEAGDALQLTGKLKDAGLDISKFDDFGGTVTTFIKEKVGDDLFAKIVSSVPELAKLGGK